MSSFGVHNSFNDYIHNANVASEIFDLLPQVGELVPGHLRASTRNNLPRLFKSVSHPRWNSSDTLAAARG